MYRQQTKPAHPKASKAKPYLPHCFAHDHCKLSGRHSLQDNVEVIRDVCRKLAQAVNPCHSKSIEPDMLKGMDEAVYKAWVAATR